MIIKFTKFSLVAVGSALVDWATFTTLHLVGLNPILSQGVGRLSGGVFSFVCNRYWSFNSKSSNLLSRQGRRFLILYVVSYTLAIALYWLLYSQIKIEVFGAKIITDCTLFVFNFFVMNFYVYDPRDGILKFLRSKN